MALINHVCDVGARSGLPLEIENLVEDAKDLIGVDRPHGQIVVGIPPIVEVEAAQHPLRQQPGDDLFDVL